MECKLIQDRLEVAFTLSLRRTALSVGCLEESGNLAYHKGAKVLHPSAADLDAASQAQCAVSHAAVQ